METIYLDNAASTMLLPRVAEDMMLNFRECYGNPSSIHREGQKAKRTLENSREIISSLFNVEGKEIIFTSGGTEGNNLILKGAAKQHSYKGKHIITTSTEHSSIMETCIELEREGYEVTFLDVDENGLIDIEELKEKVRDDTILVSIMSANNETGVKQPIKEIGEFLRRRNIFFHVDAVQTIGKEIFYPKEYHITAFTASAHKFYGPKGTGFVFLDKNFLIRRQIDGGHHERSRRAGTENVNGIYGMQKALEYVYGEIFEAQKTESRIQSYMEDKLTNEVYGIRINGAEAERVRGITNISISGCNVQTLVVNLDLRGIAVSGGAACMSGALTESHVLKAMKVSKEELNSSIRVSIGKYNTQEEIEIFIKNLKEIIKVERGG